MCVLSPSVCVNYGALTGAGWNLLLDTQTLRNKKSYSNNDSIFLEWHCHGNWAIELLSKNIFWALKQSRSYETHKLTFGIRLMHHNLTPFYNFHPLFHMQANWNHEEPPKTQVTLEGLSLRCLHYTSIHGWCAWRRVGGAGDVWVST